MTASTPRRGGVRLAALLAALVLVLLGAATLVFQRFVDERPGPAPLAAPATPPPAAAPAAPGAAAVVFVAGEVQRSAGGGAWVAVAAGDLVPEAESLRTGPGAQADLALGPGARLVLEEDSEVEVREVRAETHRLRLARGRMGVDYAEAGARRLRVEGRDGAVSAEARSARFSVISAGDVLAVATEAGGVDLSSAAGTVRVAEGEQSSATPGAPPAPVRPIPVRVVLEVAQALAERAVRDPCAHLVGRVAPGTEVRVDGAPVVVAPDGTFDVRPPRRRGAHVTVVRVRDPAGRIAERTIACRSPPARPAAPPPAPDPEIDLSVKWGRG